DHHVNYGSGSGLQDRVAFVQNDPSQYDASIRLADLQVSDTGTYQCRVKKNTVAVHEVIVTVEGEPQRSRVPLLGGTGNDSVPLPTEKPAPPQCWIEGELIWGSSIVLRCFSR
ncbi:VSIG8 protein, partial [Bucco capensis]|nr:VSIG8 protein [Bucco capensis]